MKYSILTFGCRVNQADSMDIERELRQRGGRPVSSAHADLIVVNSCSVTATADQGTRQAIRRVARENPDARIVVTGCYATRCPDELAALPSVVAVVHNDRKESVGVRSDDDGGAIRRRGRAMRRAIPPGSHGAHHSRADRVRGALQLLHHPDHARRIAEQAGRAASSKNCRVRNRAAFSR